jgi:3-isopropylmalate/(R)-2-methylmalate dehydratase small subunit
LQIRKKTMKHFNGNILFLDRSNINTDEIIPAKYLTEIDKQALKPHLLEDLKLEGFDPENDIAGKSIIVTRSNFGCGSSREHAPWALEVNAIKVVIASGFARIFRQNMFNCGMLAIELDRDRIESIFNRFAGKPSHAEVDIETDRIIITADEAREQIGFQISEFDKALVRAGGWVEYADMRY